MTLVGRAIRTVYRATIVQIANQSRRRRGLPELDRYARRCLIASTTIMGTFLAICLGVGVMAATSEPVSRDVPRAAPPVNTRTYAPGPTTTHAPPTSSTPPTASDEPVYVPLPDNDDDDFDKPRICRKRWYC
jgi:hypothetical protein